MAFACDRLHVRATTGRRCGRTFPSPNLSLRLLHQSPVCVLQPRVAGLTGGGDGGSEVDGEEDPEYHAESAISASAHEVPQDPGMRMFHAQEARGVELVELGLVEGKAICCSGLVRSKQAQSNAERGQVPEHGQPLGRMLEKRLRLLWRHWPLQYVTEATDVGEPECRHSLGLQSQEAEDQRQFHLHGHLDKARVAISIRIRPGR